MWELSGLALSSLSLPLPDVRRACVRADWGLGLRKFFLSLSFRDLVFSSSLGDGLRNFLMAGSLLQGLCFMQGLWKF